MRRSPGPELSARLSASIRVSPYVRMGAGGVHCDESAQAGCSGQLKISSRLTLRNGCKSIESLVRLWAQRHPILRSGEPFLSNERRQPGGAVRDGSIRNLRFGLECNLAMNVLITLGKQ